MIPVKHDRGESRVSAAGPTTRWSSPPQAENRMTASEKAASLSSKGTTATVFASMGSMIRMVDPQCWRLGSTKGFSWKIDYFSIDSSPPRFSVQPLHPVPTTSLDNGINLN